MYRGIGINVDGEFVDGDLRTLARLLERAAAVGFQAVELSTGTCNAIRGGQLDERELARVREVVGQYPVRCTVHAPCPLDLTRHPELAAQVMESTLRLAAGLGAHVVVYHSAQIALHQASLGLAALPGERELAERWQRETEALRHFARRAADLGLLIAVENRDPHLWEVAALARHGRTAADLLHYHQGMDLDRLCQQVAEVDSPHVGLCLDVGHAFLAAPYWPEPDYLAAVRRAAPWVRHLHLHDNFGRLDDVAESLADRLAFGQADNHLPPGWGRIPLGETLAALAQAGYAGWVIAEIRPRYQAYYEEVLASTRALCAAAWPA